MKCRKCGREVDPRLTFCPACGVRLKADPDLDELTSEIAGKVDFFMNETDNGADDGVRMENGQMILEDDPDKTITNRPAAEFDSDKTITNRSDAEKEGFSDSVFDDISQIPEENREADYYGRSDSNDAYAYGQYEGGGNPQPSSGGRKGKKKGLIAGIIVAAVLVCAVIVLCILLFAVKGNNNSSAEEESSEEEIDVITCSVSDGEEYSAPLELTLESSLDYRIYYTIDGSEPSSSSTVYSGSITFDESYIEDTDGTEITLKAVSYTDSSIKSGEFEITFTLCYAEIDSPVISPSSGNYTEETYITITGVSGAKIYYTTDGSTPTEDSNLYTGQFEMERGNTVISAIAVKNGLTSAVTTAVYNLDIPSNYSFSEARDIILEYLINRGDVADEDGNLPDDDEDEDTPAGYVDFMDGGTCIIDNDQYIVVLCYFYDANGNVTESRIYGVEDQDGDYCELEETDSGYEIK